jgi:drug/metabolite transporter (DMT)-like permease
MKVLGHCQEILVPRGSSWFYASVSVLMRFGLAFLVLLVWQWRRVGRITRLEVWQGLGLGVTAAGGIVLQMDGVQYTPASTSAFLTQSYCVIIPVYMALRHSRWPAIPVALSSLMVLVGVAILANVNWAELQLGRGEAETLLASLLFTAQILWLERPLFVGNNWKPVTLIMFGVVTVVALPLSWFTAPHPLDILRAYSTPVTLSVGLFMTLACTLMTFCLMNYWQPFISSTHASLIYCTEPVFASVFALFAPSLFSVMAGIHYANETLNARLLIGGGLILGANVIMFWQAARGASNPSNPAGTVSQSKSL